MFSIIIDFGVTLAALYTYNNWQAVKKTAKDLFS